MKRDWWQGSEWTKEQKFFFPDPEKRTCRVLLYLTPEGDKVRIYVGKGKALECRGSA